MAALRLRVHNGCRNAITRVLTRATCQSAYLAGSGINGRCPVLKQFLKLRTQLRRILMPVHSDCMLHGCVQQLFIRIGAHCHRAVYVAGKFPAINVFSRHVNLRILRMASSRASNSQEIYLTAPCTQIQRTLLYSHCVQCPQAAIGHQIGKPDRALKKQLIVKKGNLTAALRIRCLILRPTDLIHPKHTKRSTCPVSCK